MTETELPVPAHFNPASVGEVWRVPYQERARAAEAWARQHGIMPAARDRFRICLLTVDVQNTFCVPGFELFVGGRSGRGAVEDNRRLCEFIYRNLHRLTQICPTLDTHQAMQIFHAIFLVNEQGEHPAPYTLISAADVAQGKWRFNPAVADNLQLDVQEGQQYLQHYVETLQRGGKYALTIWPYHAMLGGIGHALVSAVEEAIFFHSMARHSQPDFQVKGNNPLTENYSVLRPEVLTGPHGKIIAHKNTRLLNKLLEFDVVIIAGQAKSHCVAWTIADLLNEMGGTDPALARKVYLLEDCTSPVVVPGVIDYTDEAEAAFRRFAEAGMHVVRSTEPIASWPGIA
ncbi:MAG: isochorismatase [candidate division KSB1 bacterium]|nr:isochorismatase [candidate division KSB1 bacterium]MDZ7276560.1 isochorismatase [candidate division KSB1 bacterium]MDZ7285021.1 isochorismatase [candidate division KSB1 bacterium]MDZ7298053.1 isochorismatase [candidate division KSB1 bacterium]MDZ7307441.1 isochorismatase [candidate division KSB1 bacterium]